jgi:heme/copper-type cytochrome/quinol oxidase subunit 2
MLPIAEKTKGDETFWAIIPVIILAIITAYGFFKVIRFAYENASSISFHFPG